MSQAYNRDKIKIFQCDLCNFESPDWNLVFFHLMQEHSLELVKFIHYDRVDKDKNMLVAEIGNNWNGNFNLLRKMVKQAKQTGFTHVKFQAFGEEHWKNYPQFPQLASTSVTEDNIDMINGICKISGIEWFCTPTRPDLVDLLDPYVNIFKIRWLDQYNTKLIQKVRSKRKPIIISCDYHVSWAKCLYCIPKYPTTLKEINYSKMKEFDGYSNHCPNPLAIKGALDMDMKIIEIHVTDSLKKDYIDNASSLEFSSISKILKESKKQTLFYKDSPSIPIY